MYAYADLREAADTFMNVGWNSIHDVIRCVDEEVSRSVDYPSYCHSRRQTLERLL